MRPAPPPLLLPRPFLAVGKRVSAREEAADLDDVDLEVLLGEQRDQKQKVTVIPLDRICPDAHGDTVEAQSARTNMPLTQAQSSLRPTTCVYDRGLTSLTMRGKEHSPRAQDSLKAPVMQDAGRDMLHQSMPLGGGRHTAQSTGKTKITQLLKL